MAISDISKSTTTYTVCRGDTFSEIAERCIIVNMPGYSGLSVYNAGINKLKSYNPDIENINLIYVGQKLVLQGTAATKTSNNTQKAKITAFGFQSGQGADGKTVFATWAWDNKNTDHYEVKWIYGTGDGVGFIGERTTTTYKQSVFSSAPANATNVSFEVKPVSKTYKSGKSEVHYWTAGWSTRERYYFKDNPPAKPATPTVEIKDYTLTAKVTSSDWSSLNASKIQFQILKNDKTIAKTGFATISTEQTSKGTALSYSCKIAAGSEYAVRCRAYRDGLYSDWTDYSSNYSSAPAESEGIYLLYSLSSTSAAIYWYDVSNAQGYQIQYTSIKRYFDSNPDGVTTKNIGSSEEPAVVCHTEIQGLETGKEYFFRVRSVIFDSGNSGNKYSAWSGIKSITVGTKPTAPTIWSSVTTAKSGEKINLYWVHNSADGSRQTEATLELDLDGTVKTYTVTSGTSTTASNTANKVVSLSNFSLSTGSVVRAWMQFSNTVANPKLNVNGTGAIAIKADESSKLYWDADTVVEFTYDGTYWNITNITSGQSTDSYSIDTSKYPTLTKIKWRVKTAGVLKNTSGEYIYGEYSEQRTIDVYAPPVLVLSVTDSEGAAVEELQSFPIYILASASPAVQKPIGYYLTVISNESYEMLDNMGEVKKINSGEEIYHKYFNISSNPLSVTLSANDLNLQNNVSYKISCTVSMDSGLSGEATEDFTVSWTDDEYWPNAEIGYDSETFSASIKPYCLDKSGNLIEGVTLSVYRREFDGSYTELATGLDNTDGTYITDPHPALDYARYRIVAVTNSTGKVNYYDVPGYPIGEKAAIIQWDENWKNFDITNEDEAEQPAWSGSLLRLPYNIDISDDHEVEVELVKYIGRKHPVSYYGTQLGHTSTWNMDIEKEDKETLYGLRRLAAWSGNVYVREPSGSGYWANVSVSYNQEHCVVIIPVTIKVTRVEGDI